MESARCDAQPLNLEGVKMVLNFWRKEEDRKVNDKSSAKRKRERGVILAITAIGMTAFIMAVGMAVDISHMYTVATELQSAADAAALSGASALDGSAAGVTKAVDRAVAVMNKYDVNKTSVTISRSDVRFAANISSFDNGGTGVSESSANSSPANIRFLKVTIPDKPVGVFLTRKVLSSSVNISKSAVAGFSVNAAADNTPGLNVVCN